MPEEHNAQVYRRESLSSCRKKGILRTLNFFRFLAEIFKRTGRTGHTSVEIHRSCVYGSILIVTFTLFFNQWKFHTVTIIQINSSAFIRKDAICHTANDIKLAAEPISKLKQWTQAFMERYYFNECEGYKNCPTFQLT